MFDVKMLEKYNLDIETYEKILKDCADKQNGILDCDWQDIIEKYDLGIHYDSLRKNCTGIFGSVVVKEYYEQKMAKENAASEEKYFSKLEEKKRELEREKIKYRDERNAWQKQNYSAARLDATLSILEDELKKIGKVNFGEFTTPIINGNKEMIICLSDLHIGQSFNSIFGEYNSDIAKERLDKYLAKILEVAKLHEVKKAWVVSLGDQISGNIHKSIAITNRENVIDQVKMSTEIISSFCYQLTKAFENVFFYNVSGNHSRIDRKEDAIHDERLDDLIGWAVSLCLDHIENFHYINYRNLDTGIADISVCGKTYIAVHGDMDDMTKQGVANLSMLIGFVPYAILKGHLHYPAMNEINGVKVVQSGSLAGIGDQYTIEKRLCGKPSQTFLVCDKKGIDCIYNVELI